MCAKTRGRVVVRVVGAESSTQPVGFRIPVLIHSAPQLGTRQPRALGHRLELGPDDGGMDFWIDAGL
jgi:hypothetical protein